MVLIAIPLYGRLINNVTGFDVDTDNRPNCSNCFLMCIPLGYIAAVVTIIALGVLFLIVTLLYEMIKMCFKIYEEFKEKLHQATMLEVKINT
jgi:hypothetical protein